MDNQLQQPLGRMLVNKGVISDDQLRIALQEQNKSHQPLGRLLVRLGFLSEAKSLVIPQAGEEANESLREFHFNALNRQAKKLKYGQPTPTTAGTHAGQ